MLPKNRRQLKGRDIPICDFRWKTKIETDWNEPDEIHKCSRVHDHRVSHVCNCGARKDRKNMAEEKETHDNLEAILKKKREAEDAAEKQRAEQLQQAYLKRTGRTEMKP
jgi:hypothetical protein